MVQSVCQIQVDTHLKTKFESLLRITILNAQSQKWLFTIQIVGHGGTYVAYNMEPSKVAIRHQSRLTTGSKPALELHSRAASSVGITSPFQRSQHRKQFPRKADNKKER